MLCKVRLSGVTLQGRASLLDFDRDIIDHEYSVNE